MRRRTAAFVGLAVAVVLSAVQILLWRASIVPTVVVAVSKTTLSANTPVGAAEIAPRPIPVTAFLPGMLTSFGQIAHEYPVHDIPQGEYLTRADFESAPLRDGLCQGQVSVTLEVQNAADAEGIYPGMYVDVTQPGSSGAAASGASSQGTTVARALRVISVMTQNGTPITPGSSPASGIAGLAPGSDTPSMVELAVPQPKVTTLVTASARGPLVFSQDPWSDASASEVCGTPTASPGPSPAAAGSIVTPSAQSVGGSLPSHSAAPAGVTPGSSRSPSASVTAPPPVLSRAGAAAAAATAKHSTARSG